MDGGWCWVLHTLSARALHVANVTVPFASIMELIRRPNLFQEMTLSGRLPALPTAYVRWYFSEGKDVSPFGFLWFCWAASSLRCGRAGFLVYINGRHLNRHFGRGTVTPSTAHAQCGSPTSVRKWRITARRSVFATLNPAGISPGRSCSILRRGRTAWTPTKSSATGSRPPA